jgi:hypothetical protein
MIDRLTEDGIEVNVDKKFGYENLKAAFPCADYDRSRTTTEFLHQMMQDVHVKLSPGLPWQKGIQQEEDSFHQQIGLKFKEETSEMLHLEHRHLWC